MAIIEDWEDGDTDVEFDGWAGWTGETGTLTNQQTTVISGSWTGEYESVQDGSSRDTNHRVQVTRDADFTADVSLTVRLAEDRSGLIAGLSSNLEIESASGGRVCTLAFHEDGGLAFYSGTKSDGFEGNVLADWNADQNYAIELINWDFVNDTVDVVVDGTNQGTFNINTGFDGWGAIQFQCVSDIGEASQFFYWDNIVVDFQPSAIADLAASESEDDVDLTWSDTDGEMGYDIHRSQGSGFTVTDSTLIDSVAAGTTSYTDTALDEDTYYYKVIARGETDSDPSNEASATVQVSPTNFTATEPEWNASSISVPCSWTDNSDYAGESYYIQADSGSGFSRVTGDLGTDATSTTLTGSHLSFDTTYDLRVEVDTADGSFFSDTVQVTTPMSGLPTSGYWLALVGSTASTRRVIDSGISGQSMDFTREHSAKSDFKVTVAYDQTLEDNLFSDCHLYFNTEHQFVGEILEMESDERGGTTTLSGPGALSVELTRGDAVVTYTSTRADDAMQDYLNNYSPIGGTVTSMTGEVVTDISTVGPLDTFSEWTDETPDITELPVNRVGGTLETVDSSWFMEGEEEFGTGTRDSASYSGEKSGSRATYFGGTFGANGDSGAWGFTPAYTVPDGQAELWVRYEITDASGSGTAGDKMPGLEFKLAGETLETRADGWSTSVTSLGWRSFGTITGNLPGGAERHAEIIQTAASDGTYDEFIVDAVAVVDSRYSYTFDNTVTDTGSYTALSGPEKKPSAAAVVFNQATSPYNLTDAEITTTWNNTQGSQALALSFDGGSTWDEGTNTQTHTATNGGDPTTTIDYRATFSRHTTGTRDQSPTDGDGVQTLSSLEVIIDGDTTGVIENQTFTGSHLENLQKLADRAGGRFVPIHDPDEANWTIEAFSEGDVSEDASWHTLNRKRKIQATDYANKIVGFGAIVSGSRLRTELESQKEIDAVGETVTRTFTDVSLKTQSALDSQTRVALGRAVKKDELTGTIDVVPTALDPGKTYPVPAWDSEVQHGFYALEFVNQDWVSLGTGTDMANYTGSFTVAAKVNFDELSTIAGADQVLMTKGDTTEDWSLSYGAGSDGELELFVRDDGLQGVGGEIALSDGLTAATDITVVFVFDNTGDATVRSYLDGQPVHERTNSGFNVTEDISDDVRIGQQGGTHYLDGVLSDLVWDDAIWTDAEVADYHRSGTVPSAGVAHRWEFNDGPGSTTVDDTGDGNAQGTINGSDYEWVGLGGFSLERVSYGVSLSDAVGTLDFSRAQGLGDAVAEVGTKTREVGDAL